MLKGLQKNWLKSKYVILLYVYGLPSPLGNELIGICEFVEHFLLQKQMLTFYAKIRNVNLLIKIIINSIK